MKLVTVIEASAKRAIALKLGVDPASEGAMHMEFYSALVLCKDAKLIGDEAFAFANYMRHVRNDLAHSGGALDLDVARLRGESFFKKYEERIGSFVSIQGTKISDSLQSHLNLLFMGCMAFVSLLAKELLGEEWVVEES